MMTTAKARAGTHPAINDLAGYMAGSLEPEARIQVEEHISACDECLAAVVSAYEAAGSTRKKWSLIKRIMGSMKKINIYLILAITAFSLSFFLPRYFIQLLVATLLLGIKWIVDAKTTKMLVMIYEAWKSGGEKEASKVLERIDKRF